MQNPNLENLEKNEKFDMFQVHIRLTLRQYYGHFDGDQLKHLNYKKIKQWVMNELIRENPDNESKLNTPHYKSILKTEALNVADAIEKEDEQFRLGLKPAVTKDKKIIIVKKLLQDKFPGRLNFKTGSKIVYDDKEVDDMRKKLMLKTSMVEVKRMAKIELNDFEEDYENFLKTRPTFEMIQEALAQAQQKQMKSTNPLKTEVVQIKF